MKTLILQNEHEMRFIDMPRNDPEGKAIVQIKSIGICGTDTSAYKGDFPMISYPRILGHELAGEIVSVPDNDRGIQAGDRVVIEPYMYCGACYPCSIGKTNCCENLKVLGVHVDGGMTEYIAHDLHLIHKTPDPVPWEHLAMVEPLTISLHGVHRIDPTPGEHVVITGAGTIGLLAAQVVLQAGAVPILVDMLEKRLQLAHRLGIEHTINPNEQDPVEAVRKLTGGRMAEALIEASGSPAAVRGAIDLVAFAGRISLIGYSKREVTLPTFMITRKELDIRGSRNSAREFPLAIELITGGKVKVDPIITHVIDFDELPNYFQLITNHPNDFLKIIAKLN